MTNANRFSKPFDRAFTVEGDRITAEIDGFTITARIARDDSNERPDQRDDGFWPSRNPESAGYVGTNIAPGQFEEQLAHAHAVMEAWKKDEWFYCGIILSVEYDAVELNDHAASLWGIECNYPESKGNTCPNDYLTQVANELLDEALEVGKEKLEAMSLNDSTKPMRDFISTIARLTKDGELVDGKEFILENDDAVDTLHDLISQARSLLGGPEDREVADAA